MCRSTQQIKMVRVLLPLLLPLLSLVATIHCQANDPEIVTIAQVLSHSVFRGTQVILSCSSNKPLNNVYFLRNVSGHVDRVITTGTNQGVGQETFDVTPEREGVYSCVNGNTSSRNTVELVAYPIANLSTPAKYTSHLGTNATINCAFRAGALINRYQVNWYKGLQKLNSDSTKYEVLPNFSLVVTNVTVDDAGRGYYCSVTVNTISTVVHRLGPSIELEVYDQLRMRQDIQDTVQRLGSSDPATFRCTVSGIPQPEIKWIHQGRELAQSRSNNSITRSPSGIFVTSELKLGEVIVEDTGAIQCVGYHVVGGRVSVTVSGANLIVLPEGFTVQLQVRQEGGIQINATLPSVIPGSFVLVVRYSYNQSTVAEVELLDPSFSNTQNILYTIPKDKLPTFMSFRVMAALRVNGVQGGFSEESHRIRTDVAMSPGPGDEARTDVPATLPPTATTHPGCSLSEQNIIIIASVATVAIVIALSILCALLFRMCWRAYSRKDILKRVERCQDKELRKLLLDKLQPIKADSRDPDNESGAEEEREEETTSEPAVDAIAGRCNIDESDYSHSPPNYDDSTAVNSDGCMESIEQKMKPRSLGTNAGQLQTRLAIQGVPDLDADKVPWKPPTSNRATEPCQADGGRDDDEDEEDYEGTEEKPSILLETSL